MTYDRRSVPAGRHYCRPCCVSAVLSTSTNNDYVRLTRPLRGLILIRQRSLSELDTLLPTANQTAAGRLMDPDRLSSMALFAAYARNHRPPLEAPRPLWPGRWLSAAQEDRTRVEADASRRAARTLGRRDSTDAIPSARENRHQRDQHVHDQLRNC